MKLINGFIDVKDNPIEDVGGYGKLNFGQINSMQIGSGATSFKGDDSGIWLGGETFAEAPFSVDMYGSLVASLLTIKNSSGETVIDPTGIVSGTVFPYGSISGSGTQNSSSTTPADATGLSTTFSLPREATVLFFLSVSGLISSTAAVFKARMNLDGSTIGFDTRLSYSNDFLTTTSHRVQTVSAGDHTLKVQFATSNSSYTATIAKYSTYLTYIVLGS